MVLPPLTGLRVVARGMPPGACAPAYSLSPLRGCGNFRRYAAVATFAATRLWSTVDSFSQSRRDAIMLPGARAPGSGSVDDSISPVGGDRNLASHRSKTSFDEDLRCRPYGLAASRWNFNERPRTADRRDGRNLGL